MEFSTVTAWNSLPQSSFLRKSKWAFWTRISSDHQNVCRWWTSFFNPGLRANRLQRGPARFHSRFTPHFWHFRLARFLLGEKEHFKQKEFEETLVRNQAAAQETQPWHWVRGLLYRTNPRQRYKRRLAEDSWPGETLRSIQGLWPSSPYFWDNFKTIYLNLGPVE